MTFAQKVSLQFFLAGINGAIKAVSVGARKESGLKSTRSEDFTAWYELPQYEVGLTCIAETHYRIQPSKAALAAEGGEGLKDVFVEVEKGRPQLVVPASLQQIAKKVLSQVGYKLDAKTAEHEAQVYFELPEDALRGFEQAFNEGRKITS